MDVNIQLAGWVVLVALLLASSVGIQGVIVCVLVIAFFLLGAILVILKSGKLKADRKIIEVKRSRFPLPGDGIPTIVEAMQKAMKTRHNDSDKRLTGSQIIDAPLQEILHYILRDYVRTWFSSISHDNLFPNEVWSTIRKMIISFSTRCKEVDWVTMLTQHLVEDAASHLRLYRQTRVEIKGEKEKVKEGATPPATTVDVFFQLEHEMEKTHSRHKVCTCKESGKQYLADVSELLLYLLLPKEDFSNKPLRFLAREILVNAIFLPLLDLLSDPDYINQTLIWLCKDIPATSEGFLTTLTMTDSADELQATLESVNFELAHLRSRDTGGEDDAEIKKQISSLLYVKKVIMSRIARLQEGVDTDSTGMPSNIDWDRVQSYQLFSLPLDVILKNSVALSCFMDFMAGAGAQGYLFLYLNAMGWRVSAEQQISMYQLGKLTSGSTRRGSDASTQLEGVREAARCIYEQYLAEKACPRILLEETITKQLLHRIEGEPVSESWFDDITQGLLQKFQEERYLPTFKKTPQYVRLLAELDLLKDMSKSDDDDCVSLDDLGDNESLSSLDMDQGDGTQKKPPEQKPVVLTAEIIQTTIVHEAARPFAVYTIAVHQKDPEGVEDSWHVFRRYSDFYDFHMSTVTKFESLSCLNFPGKKTFNNLDKLFLEKRKQQLNVYLKSLLSPELLAEAPGFADKVHKFLEHGKYRQDRTQLSKTADLILTPFRTVGNAVKAVPEGLLSTAGGMVGGLQRVFTTRQSQFIPSERVGSELNLDSEENIPLRILLLLMDEVFDLKSRNQWLRRRIVTLLRQIIKSMFGDIYNRRILEYVEWAIAPEQIKQYLILFRDSLWPNGSLATPQTPRDRNITMRTRVAAKTTLLSSLSDELKHIIGSETARRGVLFAFEMFQEVKLNRRLAYVLLERLIEKLFPDYNFPRLFQQLHMADPT